MLVTNIWCVSSCPLHFYPNMKLQYLIDIPMRCSVCTYSIHSVQFFVDLVADLRNYICMDSNRVYVYGYSNGGMMAWTLGQDRRSASLLAGIGAIQVSMNR